MGQIRLSIGQVNITNYLIIVVRKTTTPLVIEAQESYAPPHPTTRNVVVPASGDLDPVIYYVDAYESVDGISFDLLLSQFVYDLKNRIIISERRFYKVGGFNPTDPAPDQQILSDPYLDGKTITGIFKEGFRYLMPSTESTIEWQPHIGGGIELQGDLVFSAGEVYSVEISYLADQTAVTSGGLYNGVSLIASSVTLSGSYRNKRLRCESTASASLVVTLEPLASVPDGTFYHFTSNGGLQNQTRILPDGAETIKYNGESYTEISISKGEFVRIVKTGSFWEAELAHHGILQVGERLSGTWKDHPNCKPEDNALYDGNEWPRPWWWIKNKLPSTHYITDDNVVNPGYTHPSGKEGLFVIHSTLKKFRMPDGQFWSERGLSNFNFYGSDTERTYDYPGGTQGSQVGAFDLNIPNAPVIRKAGTANSVIVLGVPSGTVAGAPPDPIVGNENITFNNINSGKDNITRNIGVIYLRRF